MNRRDALKMLAAAPAAVLLAKGMAKPVPAKLEITPAAAPLTMSFCTSAIWSEPLQRPGSQNLSMQELNDAFLYKWIPKGPARRR